MRQNEQRALLVAILVLCFSTLMLGSAVRWAACVSAALAALAVVPLASSRQELASSRPLLLLLGIPLVATAFQLLPLPFAVVRFLAPGAAELAEASAHAYGHSTPGMLPLSQDWPGTFVELCKFAGYFAFAYVSVRLSVSRRARRWLLVSVATVGTLVAFCALGHRLVGATSLLGIYTPTVAYHNAISPFFNPNHLAGYLAFVTPVCLGLAIDRKSWLFLSMAGVCAVTSVQAVSRGGIVALCVGIIVVLFLAARSRATDRAGRSKSSPYLLAAIIGLGFAGLALFGATAGEELLHMDLRHEQDVGKFLAWRSAPDLLATSPWVGVGRGAFEFSFTRVQPASGVIFSHIENEYLQIVLDWGIPTALAIVFAALLWLRSLLRRGIVDPLAAGATGAIAALLVESLADFCLELPGVALPAIAVLATLLPARLVTTPKSQRRLVYGGRLGAVAGTVMLCALGASSLATRSSEEIAASIELRTGYTGPSAKVLSAAGHISRRHPSSYLLAARTAKVLWQRHDSDAFDVLALALNLNPNHSGVHLLAAEMLATSQRPRQAIGEYRTALEMPGPTPRIVASLEAHFPQIDDFVLGIPNDPKFESHLGQSFLKRNRADIATALASRALQRGGPKPFEIYELAVKAALATGDNARALDVATSADAAFRSDDSLLLYVTALDASTLPLVAIALLEERIALSNRGYVKELDTLAKLQIQVGDFEAARLTLEKGANASGATDKERAQVHKRLATIEEQSGNHHQAKWHREQAAALGSR